MTDLEARQFIAAHLREIADILVETQLETEAPKPAPAPQKPNPKAAAKLANTSVEAFEELLAKNIAGGRATVLQAKNPDDPQHEWATKCVGIALKHMPGVRIPKGWSP